MTEQEIALRTDWAQMIVEVNALVARLRQKPRALRAGHYNNRPGSILNAYREGDISFSDAVAALEDRT